MNETITITIETTKRELLNKANDFLTAISELASDIDCLDFSKDAADLETDVLRIAASIKTLAEAAHTCVFRAGGEL